MELSESQYMQPCLGVRMVFGEHCNHRIECSLATVCKRYLIDVEPWHDAPRIMCFTTAGGGVDVDNFLLADDE